MTFILKYIILKTARLFERTVYISDTNTNLIPISLSATAATLNAKTPSASGNAPTVSEKVATDITNAATAIADKRMKELVSRKNNENRDHLCSSKDVTK